MDCRALRRGLLLATVLPAAAAAEPVLMISIDGLRPADVIAAEARGVAVPNLRRFVKEGSYASGVRGVLPTVTYPSHATLMTGVSPARHGIVSNTSFDPLQINQGGWYWYASDCKVPTLWDAAVKAGLSTANIHWPVSVGATSIDFNLPQIWRTGHADDRKLVAALSTPGLVQALEAATGQRYAPGIDETIAGDETRGAFAVALISAERPFFTTVYLTALDHEQHAEGPGTAKAHAILTRIDTIVGTLVAAQLKAHPEAAIAVVSDHGFSTTDTEVNLWRAFIDEGLITLDADNKIADWIASPWSAGGSTAIVLKHPEDEAAVARVAALLNRLKRDPANHISELVGPAEVSPLGGNPQAHFYIGYSGNAYAGGFKGRTAPVVGPAASRGMHGYFPAHPDMRSTFMVMGRKIAKGRNLGEIDMRAIAPTLAAILGIALPDAEATPVALR